MYSYCNTIFNQLLSFLPKHKFDQFVGQHNADKYVKKLTTWNQLTALLYAQATDKESLREIETGLSMHAGKWYHLGIKSVAKSSLSDANNRRDYRIFESLFYAFLEKNKELTPNRTFKFNNPLYSFDSSTIQLSLNIFPWAYYQKAKGAIKIHTLLNNRTTIPELLVVTDGKEQDMVVARTAGLDIAQHSILVMDKAYIDLKWFRKLNKSNYYFVTRIKTHMLYRVIEEENRFLGKGVVKSEIIKFTGRWGKKHYPDKLRLITYIDSETNKEYQFMTNNLKLAPKTIANIYKSRWQIEVFFKWIKQNLKIKTFLGTSKNAVLTQIWVAMIYYLLLSYIKFQTKLDKSLLEFTRMIRETLMMRQNLIDLLSLNINQIYKIDKIKQPQLAFF